MSASLLLEQSIRSMIYLFTSITVTKGEVLYCLSTDPPKKIFKARALGFKMRQGAWTKLHEGRDCFLMVFVFRVPDVVEAQCWF